MRFIRKTSREIVDAHDKWVAETGKKFCCEQLERESLKRFARWYRAERKADLIERHGESNGKA